MQWVRLMRAVSEVTVQPFLSPARADWELLKSHVPLPSVFGAIMGPHSAFGDAWKTKSLRLMPKHVLG